jgi:hypothetical protein
MEVLAHFLAQARKEKSSLFSREDEGKQSTEGKIEENDFVLQIVWLYSFSILSHH